MKQIKEMSKDKLMKLIMKYYKSINSKNDLANELLENFEVDLNTFSKSRIHKLIHNYYNGLTEAQLRKEVMDNFELELPKKKEERKKPVLSSYQMKKLKQQLTQQKKDEEEQIKQFENSLSYANVLPKKEEGKINNKLEQILNLYIEKGKPTRDTGIVYSPIDVIDYLILVVLMEKTDIKCPIESFMVSNDKSINIYYFMEDKPYFDATVGSTKKNIEQKEEFLNKITQKIINCIKKGIDRIIFRLNMPQHANLVFINPKKKEIILIEPQSIEQKDTLLNAFMREAFVPVFNENIGEDYKYIAPIQICPKKPVGLFKSDDSVSETKFFQQIEQDSKGQAMKSKEGGGFCMLWSWFFAILIINNPDMTIEEIVYKAFEILGNEPKVFEDVIRGFVLEMYDEIEKLHNDIFNKLSHEDLKKIFPSDKLKTKDIQRIKDMLNLVSKSKDYPASLSDRSKFYKIIRHMIDKKHDEISKEKGAGLRSLYKHKSGVNLGFINKKHFKNTKCLCSPQQKKKKMKIKCSCEL